MVLMSQPKPPHRHWTSEQEELLGRKSDRALARKFGRSVTAVAARRRQRQISLIKTMAAKVDDKLWASAPAEQVALLAPSVHVISGCSHRRRQLGIPSKHPDYHQWKPGEVAMLAMAD